MVDAAVVRGKDQRSIVLLHVVHERAGAQGGSADGQKHGRTRLWLPCVSGTAHDVDIAGPGCTVAGVTRRVERPAAAGDIGKSVKRLRDLDDEPIALRAGHVGFDQHLVAAHERRPRRARIGSDDRALHLASVTVVEPQLGAGRQYQPSQFEAQGTRALRSHAQSPARAP